MRKAFVMYDMNEPRILGINSRNGWGGKNVQMQSLSKLSRVTKQKLIYSLNAKFIKNQCLPEKNNSSSPLKIYKIDKNDEIDKTFNARFPIRTQRRYYMRWSTKRGHSSSLHPPFLLWCCFFMLTKA